MDILLKNIVTENTYRLYDNNTESKIISTLGEKYIKYRKAWNNATPSQIPLFPIHLDFEFFDICNQSCVFCPRNEILHKNLPYKINTKAKLEEDILDRIISESQAENLMSVNFGAFAEPLIYKNLFSLIKKFVGIGVIDTRVITNGLLLDKYIDEIFESKLVNLYISIDAFSEITYQKQRGHGYTKVVNNILKVINEKKKRKSIFPIIRVSFVETDLNKDEKKSFINFWMDKVDHIDLQKKIDYTKSSENFYNNEKQWNCIDPFRRMSIISDGSILPCCSFWGRSLVIGNIKNISIKKAWEGSLMKRVREDLILNKSSICNTCQSEN